MPYKPMTKKSKKNKKQTKRRIYGGNGEITQYNRPAVSSNETNVGDSVSPSGYVSPSAYVEPPTVKSNMTKMASIGLQYGNNIVGYYLNMLATAAGVDPNKTINQEVNNISEKAKRIILALQTPEGQQLLKDTANLTITTTKTVVAPAVNELIEELLKNLDRISQQASQLLLNTLEEIPGPGTLIGLARVVDNLINIVDEGTDLTKNLLHTADDVTKEVKTKQGELNNLTNRLSNLLDSTQLKVDEYGKKMNEKMIPPPIDYPVANAYKPLETVYANTVGGSSIKKLHKESTLIGGRINKSRSEFLTSSVVKRK